MTGKTEKVVIKQRKLREDEIELLIEESRKFPDLGLIKRKLWNEFDSIYVVTKNNKLVGICSITSLKKWIKIGPLIVIEQFQGRSYGKLLLTRVVEDHKNKNIYIGSSNEAVWKMAKELNFQERNGFINLPNVIKTYLVKYFLDRIDFDFIFDGIRKRLKNKNKYRYFLKYSS